MKPSFDVDERFGTGDIIDYYDPMGPSVIPGERMMEKETERDGETVRERERKGREGEKEKKNGH